MFGQRLLIIIVILVLSATSTFANDGKIQAFTQANSSTMNDDNWWYVGKGARENMYMKYQIQHVNANNGEPFNMTLYFSKFNNTGEYWLTSILVEDNNKGQVTNGTFHLSNGNLGILPSSQIPSNMKAYQDVYSDTLDWLSASTYKGSPHSLDAKNWGQIAAPDLVIVRNLGNERVEVPGGAFDTTIFGRIDNTTEHRIWISKDLPYPVKGEHFESPSENASLSLTSKFELLEVGTGHKNPPTSGIDQVDAASSIDQAQLNRVLKVIANTAGDKTVYGYREHIPLNITLYNSGSKTINLSSSDLKPYAGLTHACSNESYFGFVFLNGSNFNIKTYDDLLRLKDKALYISDPPFRFRSCLEYTRAIESAQIEPRNGNVTIAYFLGRTGDDTGSFTTDLHSFQYSIKNVYERGMSESGIHYEKSQLLPVGKYTIVAFAMSGQISKPIEIEVTAIPDNSFIAIMGIAAVAGVIVVLLPRR